MGAPRREYAPLRAALASLKYTGADGFEGLVRDLVSHLTGVQFRLMKSGHQHGADIASDGPPGTPVVKVECKAYGSDPRLSVDALSAKLDLWVLAATREISAQDASTLRGVGDARGLDIVILDWPESRARLPTIALLCATAPVITLSFTEGSHEVRAALEAIQQNPGFETERQTLQERLMRPTVGYEFARRAAVDWLREGFGDRAIALHRLNGAVTLDVPATRPVARPTVSARLDDWWGGQLPRPPLALLGLEGH